MDQKVDEGAKSEGVYHCVAGKSFASESYHQVVIPCILYCNRTAAGVLVMQLSCAGWCTLLSRAAGVAVLHSRCT